MLIRSVSFAFLKKFALLANLPGLSKAVGRCPASVKCIVRVTHSRPQTELGEGDDFAGVRAYVPGESQRHIDWRAVARGQPLMTKQFAAEAEGVRASRFFCSPLPLMWKKDCRSLRFG